VSTDAGLSVYAKTLRWSPVPRGCTDLSRVCDLSVYAKVLDCLSVQACYTAHDPTKMGAAMIASATVPYPRVLGPSEGSPDSGLGWTRQPPCTATMGSSYNSKRQTLHGHQYKVTKCTIQDAWLCITLKVRRCTCSLSQRTYDL